MPTNYKVTFFFEGFQAGEGVGGGSAVGWTETWYQTSNLNIAAFSTDASILYYRIMRTRFLSNIYSLVRIRVADDQNPRNVKVPDLRSRPGDVAPSANSFPAQVTCAALVDFVAAPAADNFVAHHRRMLFRGLMTGMMNGNVINANSDSFTAFRDFLIYLTTGVVPAIANGGQAFNGTPVWALRYLPRSASAFPISSLVVDPANDRQIQVQLGPIVPPTGPPNPAPTPSTGSRWLVRGVRLPYKVNRVWTVTASTPVVNPTTSTLGRSRFHLSHTWSNDGTMTAWGPAYATLQQYHIIGLRSRDTGRPFARTRGRRNPVT